jgi:hypothetical protein
MNKFSILNESHNTVEKSTTIDEVIINLVKETLNYKIDNNNKTNIVKLLESLKILMEVQKSKDKIELLEAVRINSIKHFDMNWINTLIDSEKEILESNNYEKILESIKNINIDEFIDVISEELTTDNNIEAQAINDDENEEEISNDEEEEEEEEIESFDNEGDTEDFDDSFLQEKIKQYQDYIVNEDNESKEDEDDLTEDDTYVDDDNEDEEEEEETENENGDDLEDYESPEEKEKPFESKREKILKFEDFKK